MNYGGKLEHLTLSSDILTVLRNSESFWRMCHWDWRPLRPKTMDITSPGRPSWFRRRRVAPLPSWIVNVWQLIRAFPIPSSAPFSSPRKSGMNNEYARMHGINHTYWFEEQCYAVILFIWMQSLEFLHQTRITVVEMWQWTKHYAQRWNHLHYYHICVFFAADFSTHWVHRCNGIGRMFLFSGIAQDRRLGRSTPFGWPRCRCPSRTL